MSSLFETRLQSIEDAKRRRASGKRNSIPFPIPKLNKYIPGIIKGMYYCVTANTGEGKTQLTKFLFVKSVVDYAIKNNANVKIIYFALEESKEDFIDSMIIDKLYQNNELRVDHYDLESMREELPEDIVKNIKTQKEYFEHFEKYVDIVDTISNPTGIFTYIRDYSDKNGTHWFKHYEDRETLITKRDYKNLPEARREEWRYSHYEPHDKDEHVIIIADHLSLISTEKGSITLHSAMQKIK
jgi:replicative DNA helicase